MYKFSMWKYIMKMKINERTKKDKKIEGKKVNVVWIWFTCVIKKVLCVYSGYLRHYFIYYSLFLGFIFFFNLNKMIIYYLYILTNTNTHTHTHTYTHMHTHYYIYIQTLRHPHHIFTKVKSHSQNKFINISTSEKRGR